MKTHPEYTATGTTQAGRVKDVCTAEEQEPQVPTQAQVEDFALIRPLPCTSIILDLGDVLAFYSAAGLDLPVSPPTIRRILKSTAWAELECGQISRAACLSRSGQDFDVKPQDIEESLQLLAGTLRYNTELVDLIRYIRSAARGDVKVYLATNITAQDWEILRPAVESWEIIDGIFPSFELGARKPQGQYFKRLLDSIGVAAETALFVDDKADNIVAGRVIGMECVQFVDSNKTIAAIKNAFGDPVARGEAWLSAHAGEMWSETSTGVVIRDTFAQLMILENTSDPRLVILPKNTGGTWNVFQDEPVLTTSVFPDDLDTTSLAMRSADGISKETRHAVMDEMLQYMGEDGLFNAYFDHTRLRIDTSLSANVLNLFHAQGRAYQLRETISYMIAVARTRAYESATLYYLHPEWFFYYLSGLFAASDNDNTDDDDGTDTAANSIDPCGSGGTGDQDQDQEHHLLLLTELRTILRARLAERFGDPDHSDPWSLALRLVAARNLGLFRRRTSFSSSHGTEDQDARLERDIRKLRLSQARDGSFGAEKPWIYRYGHGLLVGNVGLVTAVAVRALRGFSS